MIQGHLRYLELSDMFVMDYYDEYAHNPPQYEKMIRDDIEFILRFAEVILLQPFGEDELCVISLEDFDTSKFAEDCKDLDILEFKLDSKMKMFFDLSAGEYHVEKDI